MHEDHLDVAEEQHLRSLTAAEAEGDERAVEAALRPAASRRWSARPACGSSSGSSSRPPAAARAGARPRAAVRAARTRQDHARDDHRPRDVLTPAPDQRAGDHPRGRPGAILSGMNDGDVLFVDEIHRMSRPAEEMLYMAMEDFRVDVVIGKGPGRPRSRSRSRLHARRGDHPGRPAAGPLRDRFGFTGHLEFYEPHELDLIVHRSAGLLGVELTRRAPARSPRGPAAPPHRQPPPPAGARLRAGARRRHRDAGRGQAALELYEVDELGLDRLDRAVIDALCRRFGGGPVGVSTLAVAVGEERETVEEVAEPFLVRMGFLARTPRGRVATAAAWQHLGLAAPPRTTSVDVTLFED